MKRGPLVRLIGLWYAFVVLYPAIDTLFASLRCLTFFVMFGTHREVESSSGTFSVVFR